MFDICSRAESLSQIPFLLLTNGGGYIEADKAAQIGKIIDMDIPAEQVRTRHDTSSV